MDVKYTAEVCVACGGPAAVSADASPSRQVQRVILIEQSGVLGGASMLAGISEIINFDDGRRFL